MVHESCIVRLRSFVRSLVRVSLNGSVIFERRLLRTHKRGLSLRFAPQNLAPRASHYLSPAPVVLRSILFPITTFLGVDPHPSSLASASLL